jgi:hypothetical protein
VRDAIKLPQAGRVDEAIELFLQCAFPDETLTVDLLSDPAYRPACDRAVLFVFEATQAR